MWNKRTWTDRLSIVRNDSSTSIPLTFSTTPVNFIKRRKRCRYKTPLSPLLTFGDVWYIQVTASPATEVQVARNALQNRDVRAALVLPALNLHKNPTHTRRTNNITISL